MRMSDRGQRQWRGRACGRVFAGLASVLGLLAIAGCASGGKASIQSGARVVKTGTGSFDYTVPADGEIWVYDANSDRLIVLAGVNHGQTVHVDAAASEVRVDDKVVSHHPINSGHQYRIYYERTAQASGR
jgi:hypothetical protein